MTDAEDARLQAFLKDTDQEERDWSAFCQFQEAVDEVTQCAAMSNCYDEPDMVERECKDMRPAVWGMMLGLVPRIGLGEVITNPEIFGYAIRYGVIQPSPQALDHIRDLDAFDEFRTKVVEVEGAARRQREAEVEERVAQRARRSRKTRPATKQP
jgi:hypothetical protein